MGKGKRVREIRDRRPTERKDARKVKLAIRQWIPAPHEPCPCGTGLSYARCCGPRLTDDTAGASAWRRAQESLAAGKVEEAEAILRAALVQYLRWVFEHTVPVPGTEAPFLKDLIRIDVDALQTLADGVAHCMFKLGKTATIIPFLNHIESVVPLDAFRARATYLRAAWLYIGLDDPEAARTELRRLGDILRCSHRETLELYLDVFGGTLPPRQKIALCDTILNAADGDFSIRVQYSTIKAVALVMIGEEPEAERLLSATLTDSLVSATLDKSDDSRLRFVLANALAFLAKLSGDASFFPRAERILQSIDEEHLTAAGQAKLHLELGRVYFDQQQYERAVEALSRSRTLEPAATTEIHLAHAHALGGSPATARELLRNIERQPIPAVLQLEHLAALAAVAVKEADTVLASEVVRRLRQLLEDSPFWSSQRDRLVIELMDFVARPTAIPTAERQNRIVAAILWLNQVLELKPNVLGLGVNINKLIEKMGGQADR
jgi:tetratricopeptide (TPR) repeat protein